MNIKPSPRAATFEVLSIIGLGNAFIVTGLILKQFSLLAAKLFDQIIQGEPLPTITEIVLSLPDKMPVMLVFVLTGMIGVGVLLWLRTIEPIRGYLVFFITLGWTVIFLCLGTIIISFMMPLISITSGANNIP